jgi:hypothetical protein
MGDIGSLARKGMTEAEIPAWFDEMVQTLRRWCSISLALKSLLNQLMSGNQGCFDQNPKPNQVNGIPEEIQEDLQISCWVVQKIWDLCSSIVKVWCETENMFSVHGILLIIYLP